MIEVKREITSIQIAEALAKSGSRYIEPTREQRDIIESKHWGPSVIIAGAGSGKTETMTQRVLWLVVNGVVKPEEILGLTFTRKAAGELSARIRKRLRQLSAAGLLPQDSLTGQKLDLTVDVSTYHSYAGRTLATHGIRMGIDAQSEPIGEAAAWQLFSEIVGQFAQTEHPLERSPNTIVDSVMALSSQLGEHDRTLEEVREITTKLLAKFETISDTKSNDDVRSALSVLRERLSILPMVAAADQRRLEEGKFTFDDQMSLAAQLVTSIEEIRLIERRKYKIVLLDEYQDTSQSQVRFLSALFGQGYPVTAVGDPNQAIYGWRGASAATLERFTQDFAADGVTCEKFTLLTSWRNDQKVLDFANRIVDQIALSTGSQSSVNRLALKNEVLPGRVHCGLYLTARDEAVAIANEFKELWFAPERLEMSASYRSSFAVLVRSKSYIPDVEQALREAGIPVEVVGLGGLIHIPEIAEIIALLRSLTFPDAGTSMARLLTGPRLSIGTKDLAALGSFAKSMTESSHQRKSSRLEDILESGEITSLESDDFAIGSIIEALENISEAPADRFSTEGLSRLKEFARELSLLRRELKGSITDCLIEAERFLRLDSEVLVRDGWQSGRRHLDKFLDEAANFQRNGGSLTQFLKWLEVTDKREGGLKPASITVSNAAVQILTIHTAKGAEWDHVAIPGLVKGNFPSSGKKSDSWMKNSGSLPFELRRDSLQFGFTYEFPPQAGPKHAEVKKSLVAFDDLWRLRRVQEEYRLAYVAFTRAKHTVIGTASIYREGSKEKDLSELYIWLREYLLATSPECILHEAVNEDGVNPVIETPRTAEWPVQSTRAQSIQRSAEIVHTASSTPLTAIGANLEESAYLNDAKALVAELEARRVSEPIYLPARLSVSALMTLARDPESLAQSIRRPMPTHTDPYAKRGTAFHTWIERYFKANTLFDDEIFDPSAAEEVPLNELKQSWLASEWAAKVPHGVEVGFETTISGIIVRGRIDAIYATGDGKYEVIDWKTGKQKSEEDLAQAAIQLAMYRLAYSKLYDIDLLQISAGFHYVSEGVTIRPADLMDEVALTKIIASLNPE